MQSSNQAKQNYGKSSNAFKMEAREATKLGTPREGQDLDNLRNGSNRLANSKTKTKGRSSEKDSPSLYLN